eukprot:16784-Alexandrium_andersonii.AAC.1
MPANTAARRRPDTPQAFSFHLQRTTPTEVHGRITGRSRRGSLRLRPERRATPEKGPAHQACTRLPWSLQAAAVYRPATAASKLAQ